MATYATLSDWEAAQGSAGWVSKYSVDWPAEFAANGAHDFKVDGTYTDLAGVTWDIADDTINGDGFASAIDLAAGGLVVTTSGTGSIIVKQFVETVLHDYEWSDRLAYIAEVTSADQAANYQFIKVQFGRDPLTDGGALLMRHFGGPGGGANTYTEMAQSTPIGVLSVPIVVDSGVYNDVLGLEIAGDSLKPYWGAAVPAVPFTGLTEGSGRWCPYRRYDQDNPWTEDEAHFGVDINRNNGANFTATIKSMGLWKHE